MNSNDSVPPVVAAMARLMKATRARETANSKYREALFSAIDSGASIRDVAAAGKLSTRTLQDWLKQRT